MGKFQKAQKKKAKLRLGITGPSGAGKTYSALRLAAGLGGRTAVIDTEKGSASLYADKFDFDVLELTPPYSPERYIEAMNDAVKEGYDNIIMDSISHAWAGEGGLLNKKEQLDARGGNSFANWAKMTPIQEKFVSAIVSCSSHIIVTMRSKQEYIISENDKGKQAPRKVGLAPIQREGFEYELTTVFDIAINHEAETSKDRTGIFVDKVFKITEETGKILKQWLEDGKELLTAQPINESTPKVTENNTQSPDNKNESPIENLFNLNENDPEVKEQKEPEIRPNEALGVYEMKAGKFSGIKLYQLPKIDLQRYVQSNELYAQHQNIQLPEPVQENIYNIKKYLGLK